MQQILQILIVEDDILLSDMLFMGIFIFTRKKKIES